MGNATELKSSLPADFLQLKKDGLVQLAKDLNSQLNQPATEATPEERSKAAANNMSVGLITKVFPIKRKDGTIIEGGFNFKVTQSTDVYAGGTKEEPKYEKNIFVQETWFKAWDNGTPVGTQLNELLTSNDWALVRLFWNFDGGKASGIIDKPIQRTDSDGNVEDVLDANGNPITRKGLQYAPDKRVVGFEILKAGKNASTNVAI